MTSKRSARSVVLASMALLLAACGRREETQVDTALGTVDTAAAVSVTEIDVGKSIAADKRLTAATTDFMARDTIYAVVSTQGTAPSATLQARWTFEDGQVVDETTQTIAPTGPAVTEFHISKPDGFPKGKYRVEILLNGTPAGTKEFTVK
ncbi:MAG: hypothetical protein ACT4P6_24175 [Gemmatimonadaceae bacterium]